ALYEVPNERRAACCDGRRLPSFAGECARVLSFAVKSKAVTVSEAGIDGCRSAVEKAHEGCDWVTPLPLRTPDACQHLVRGTLAEKPRCRSTLECADGLICAGVSPTTIGVCAKPAKIGAICGTGVDPLASMVLSRTEDDKHAACAEGTRVR